MIKKIEFFFQILKQMGARYVTYRLWFVLKSKTGLLRWQTPQQEIEIFTVEFEKWKTSSLFFFDSKPNNPLNYTPEQLSLSILKENVSRIKDGETLFFYSEWKKLGIGYDWVTNPMTAYRYDTQTHWSKIPDFDPQKGDIKYVWEKSRFTFLYDLIRDEFWNGHDNAGFVFSSIKDWIEKNPINSGPNYKCAQEISIRVLNWCFALNFYKQNPKLKASVWNNITHSIRQQVKHVEETLNFSLICVRNNHAITESFCLFAIGHLFPEFPESERWKKKGKKHLEEEILYQFYEDGTYLQFSTNYQRVAMQVVTWALILGEKWGSPLAEEVKNRLKNALIFMKDLMDEKSGILPNYGANDGALFFKLNSSEFRDFRPQMNVLNQYFFKTNFTDDTNALEDAFWYGLLNEKNEKTKVEHSWKGYEVGGFYTYRKNGLFLMLRSGSHKDRPSQADNHHLDLWLNGTNLLRDNGSYLYNTDAESQHYFFGTASHNTMMLGKHNQMKKGSRFIWTNWTQQKSIRLDEGSLESVIKAFTHIHESIEHHRSIQVSEDGSTIEVYDEIVGPNHIIADNTPSLRWHICDDFEKHATISIFDENGNELSKEKIKTYHSSHYGQKEDAFAIMAVGNHLTTKIIIKQTNL